MFLAAAISGTAVGHENFRLLAQPYYQIMDLKVIGHLVPSIEYGQDVLDAGIVYFAEGSKIDRHRAWHFKQGTLYCVAPVVSNRTEHPATSTFDFWVVGKDCCNVGASDFFCGAWHAHGAHSAIRALDEESLKYYTLAVEQAKSLYGIAATHPIFLEWSSDPIREVNGWLNEAFRRYLFACACFFLCSLTTLVIAISCFACMGRAKTMEGFAQRDLRKRQQLFFKRLRNGYDPTRRSPHDAFLGGPDMLHNNYGL
jgi:hypothetical protein